MTFCLGMIVQEGIVGIADSRLTSGTEIISAKKVSVYQQGQGSFHERTSDDRYRSKSCGEVTSVLQEDYGIQLIADE